MVANGLTMRQDQTESATLVPPSTRHLWWKRDEQKQPKAKEVKPRRDFSDLDNRYTRRKERYEREQLELQKQRELEGQQQGQTANNSSQEHVTIELERMKHRFFSFFKKKPTPTHVYELKGTSALFPFICNLHVSLTDSGLDESNDTIHITRRSNDIPIDPPSEACETSEPRNVLARIFHFKPEIRTLALRVHREEVMHWLFHLLRAHSDKGLRDIHHSETAVNEFSVTVDKKNCKFPYRYLIQIYC